MKWKKHTLRIALITFSIVSSLLAVSPNAVCSAELRDAKKLSSIEYIMSSGYGPNTELKIKLTSPATYTSYKTISPLRLVIDLSQVTQGNISSPIVINKGNFKTVSVSRFDTDAGVLTRLEIELVDDIEAVISALPSNPGSLKISFPALSETSSVPKKDTVKSTVAETVSTALSEALPATATDIVFRNLTDISVNKNIITLALDGSINDFKSFRLNKPERFVVDLMNARSVLPSRLLPLNASGVASARIGLYPDKVRVVFDSVNGSFPEATAVKKDSSVVITLDTKPVDENVHTKLTATRSEKPSEEKKIVVSKPAPVPAVRAESASDAKPVKQSKVKIEEPKPVAADLQLNNTANKSKQKTGVASIEMIDFQVVDGISRLSVKINGEIDAEPPVKAPGYVTLTIKKSTLPKNLQRSLETRSFVSPILRVTPLLIKTKKGTDTKIRVATRVDTSFSYRHEGDMLFIDFKHPEGMSGDKLIVDAAEKKSKQAQAKAAPVADADIPAELSPVSESNGKLSTGATQGYKGRKITLEFADAEVRKIFQLLSEVSNKNFVLGDEVTGNISLKLVNVPWDQALDIILDTKGLDKREDGNIIIIKGKGKFKSQAEEELEIKKSIAKGIELKTEMFSVNYSDVAAISSQFNGLKSDRGIISTDARTSSVIVKDVPQAIEDMRKLLKQLDVPEKQVMIEARIIEATSTFTRSLGVNWGLHYRDGSGSFMGINQLDTSFGGLANAAPSSGQTGLPGAAMGISFGKLTSNVSLDLRLNAAASAGLIKIISSPKVATLNNKAAKISQGQQIPYTSTTSDKIETKFIAATLSLEVTPHINANGTIAMKIDAKNDAPGTGNPPPINTKQATTELLLKDGETTVIGGIFVDSEQDGDDGVPFLMDIPFLGKIFSSSTKTKTKSELLIFVTPRILGSI
ncbi:MAG: type IV pilus secretin PilQ [Geobacteraceae bacterium]|nr:type IV pilus secretin PilQ [Geobacteraceae bacterium]NTW79026.1 type IV pilus secretin PilQ [Geobacteraceae bacterium]